MVLIAIVYLIEQILILKIKNLILQQCRICFLVFNFLYCLFLLLVITDKVVLDSLLLFALMIDFEQFLFCFKILIHINIVITPVVDESVSFVPAATTIIGRAAERLHISSQIAFVIIAEGPLSIG